MILEEGDTVWFELAAKPHYYGDDYSSEQPRWDGNNDGGATGKWVCGVVEFFRPGEVNIADVTSDYGFREFEDDLHYCWSFQGDGFKHLKRDKPQAKSEAICVCPREVWLNGCRCGAITPYRSR